MWEKENSEREEQKIVVKSNGYNADIIIKNNIYPSDTPEILKIVKDIIEQWEEKIKIILEDSIAIWSTLILWLSQIENEQPHRILVKATNKRVLNLLQELGSSVKFKYN